MRLTIAVSLAVAACGSAQDGLVTTKPALGFGVDTGTAPVRDIVRSWSAYLSSAPEVPKPSEYWLQSEQKRWRDYDLTGRWVYQGFAATVVEVRATRQDSTQFVVKTLYANIKNGAVLPWALQTVYASREADGWRFGNALPHATVDWQRVTVGPLRFVIEPGADFQRTRAERAAAFVQSLSRRFGIKDTSAIDYVVARSSESMTRAIGLDWVGGNTGGRAYPENRLVLSGNPSYGEAYLHELVHIVLAPLSGGESAYWLASEGLASWLGGSQGKTPVALFTDLARYQKEHPGLRLEDVFSETDEAAPVLYSSAALLVALVHERGGDAAVRLLISASHTLERFRAALRTGLAMTDDEIEAAWRSAPHRLVDVYGRDPRGTV